jgi:hypothetical protein
VGSEPSDSTKSVMERFRLRQSGDPDLRRLEPRTHGSPVRQPFAMVYRDYFSAISKVDGPAAVLLLDLIRQEGLPSVRRNEGWLKLKEPELAELGLNDKDIRYRATQRLVALRYIETQQEPGGRLQYRLVPNWWKPKAKVVDLVTRRKARS